MKKLLFTLLLSGFAFAQTVQEAKTLLNKDPESYQGKLILEKVITKEPKNADAYYEIAKYYLGKNMYSYVRENIEKAVELSPETVGYRWIRANSVKYDFQKGIDDLNFMTSKGVQTGKVYFLLGKLNYEYARKLKYQPELKNDYGYSDKNAENEKILAANDTKIKELLNEAKTAFKAYEKTTGESAEVFFVDIERMEKKSTSKYPMFNDFFDRVGLSEEKKGKLILFQNKKLNNTDVFKKDLKAIVSLGVFTPSSDQAECLNYFLSLNKLPKDFSKIKNSTYEELFAFAEGQCYIRDKVVN